VEFELIPLTKRLESQTSRAPKPVFSIESPKPSFTTLGKMASEIDCPNCKASLECIPRFKHLGIVGTLMPIAIVAIRLLGVRGHSEIFIGIFLPLMLLNLAAGIWDNRYPRLRLRERHESQGQLNPNRPPR
jgi:hypothetical protein